MLRMKNIELIEKKKHLFSIKITFISVSMQIPVFSLIISAPKFLYSDLLKRDNYGFKKFSEFLYLMVQKNE